MERPLRDNFQSQGEYEKARGLYVDFMLGARKQFEARIAALEETIERLTASPDPVTSTVEDKIREHAQSLILNRYSATDQMNIMRKGQRLGAAKAELLALEVMDEWIDAVRGSCASHLAELAAMPEDARDGYDWLQGWPKEA